ncbi:hypothetical protein BDV09DRAFT_135047 [Aspergillus tetrazonus]
MLKPLKIEVREKVHGGRLKRSSATILGRPWSRRSRGRSTPGTTRRLWICSVCLSRACSRLLSTGFGEFKV